MHVTVQVVETGAGRCLQLAEMISQLLISGGEWRSRVVGKVSGGGRKAQRDTIRHILGGQVGKMAAL